MRCATGSEAGCAHPPTPDHQSRKRSHQMTTRLALFFMAAATLMLELVLTRVFDVILNPNMAYMVIACALFSFGLAGVYVTLQPDRFWHSSPRWLPILAILFTVS